MKSSKVIKKEKKKKKLITPTVSHIQLINVGYHLLINGTALNILN